METYKIKFIADGIVSGKVEFEEGKIYEISNEFGSADRWIKRGHINVSSQDDVISKEDLVEALDNEVELAVESPKNENKKEKKLPNKVK